MQRSREYLQSKKPADQLIRGRLDANETILWSGRPIPLYALWSGFPGKSWMARIFYIAVGLIVIQPFSLAGLYFGKAFFSSPFNFTGIFSVFAGLFVILIILGLGIGPYLYIAWPRIRSYRNSRHVYYVLTNRRAMILYIRNGKIEDEMIKGLRHISDPWIKMPNSKGIGDLVYDSGGAVHSGGDGPEYSSHYDVGFEGIADAKSVLDIMRTAIAATGKRANRKTQPDD